MPVKQPIFINRSAANLGKRTSLPKLIVLHHSGGSRAGDLSWLTRSDSHVSADFYVSKRGVIYKLNPQLSQYYTWHAGTSEWRGHANINNISIGIEQEHKPGEAWTKEQIRAVAHLCAWLMDRYGLRLDDHCIQGHAAVATPKGRKTDPENFPWTAFSEYVRSILIR